MKLLPILCSICVFSVMMIQAQESPDLPDLPETQTTPSMPDTATPDSSNRELPNTNQVNPRMPRMTQEQIDKANKDKNWLTEGLKEKEIQAKALRDEEARSQKSIIDEILERNQQEVTKLNAENAAKLEQQNSGQMKAALSTTAWEPLEPMQSSSYAAAMGEESTSTNSSQDFQKFDAKTGISNVFFNPATGSFENQPVDYSSNMPDRPELQKPWIQSGNQVVEATEQKQVEAFEAKMLQQARAENKLPQNFRNPTLNLNTSSSPLLASNSTTTNPNTINPNIPNNQFGPQIDASSNNGYSASAAKLRMMEEERQRKIKADKKTTAMDIHSPSQNKGISFDSDF